MLRKYAGMVVVAAALVAVESGTLMGGWFCGSKCTRSESCAEPCETSRECCRPKRCRCLCPDAPRGEVAFAIPGVVRSGQAIQVSDEVARRGVEQAVARDLRRKETESGTRGLEEDRLDKLEKDVEKLAEATNRLSVIVDRLDRKVGKQD